MYKLTLTILVASFLSGCATLSEWNSAWFGDDDAYTPTISDDMQVVNVQNSVEAMEQPEQAPLNTIYVNNAPSVDNFGSLSQQPTYMNSKGLYQGHSLTKHVGNYVQNMAQDLISNMEYLTDTTPVGVTNFALIDSDLQRTNLLGFQLAESFMHELHKFRIPVVDFKATEYIRVTPTGDFLLSRDFLELKHKVTIEYILTGTMTKHQGGYLVNARILGLQSKAVVASAQMLIPYYVVDALVPTGENMVDGVNLIQGE